MAQIEPRFEIRSDQIDLVMRTFYQGIRQHAVLGPIFAIHVKRWPEHEAKIGRFWKKAILHERGYDGNPMMVHAGVAEMRAEHFELWLELFDATLQAELPASSAIAWSALAHRIGRGLRLGIEQRDMPKGSVPLFT